MTPIFILSLTTLILYLCGIVCFYWLVCSLFEIDILGILISLIWPLAIIACILYILVNAAFVGLEKAILKFFGKDTSRIIES